MAPATASADVLGGLRHARRQLTKLRRGAASARYVARLPVATLDQLFPGANDRQITLQHRFRPRALPFGEAYILSLITACVGPRRIFEIGTACGDGTVLLARQAPDARIETLDLGNEPSSFSEGKGDPPIVDLTEIGAAFRGTAHEQRITQHFGDSVRFDYTPFVGTIDLVFVDGAHTYEFARADSLTALSLIRPGGVIVWDDCHYHHAGVSQALLGLRRAGHPIVKLEGSRFAVLKSHA